MKTIIILIFLLLIGGGSAFAEGRSHDGGHNSHHDNNHYDNHYNNNYHYNGWDHHNGWNWNISIGPMWWSEPRYYYPPPQVIRCRVIDLYDQWGRYMGSREICD